MSCSRPSWLELAAPHLLAACALLSLAAATSRPAAAITIELKDVAPDRIERQRRASEGALPLPGTPNTAAFDQRLAEHGLKPGMPMLIRIFKEESELEIWMKRDETYVLFATYPICHWSGTLGPKLSEGDKQTPEGFYTVTGRQLHRIGRWPKALNLGFPNAFDKGHARTGSYILVHGGCSSVGCFAMTNTVINEVFGLTTAAIRAGQAHVPVHVFPFRMTEANLARHASSPWRDFWIDLKQGYDSFERLRLPPQVSVCEGRYHVTDASEAEVVTASMASGRLDRRFRRLASLKGAIQTRCPAPATVLAAKSEPSAPALSASDAQAGRVARVRPKQLPQRDAMDDTEQDARSSGAAKDYAGIH
ncbi:MAG: murein L,D-transpeptidase family protein [Pseudomonadota bacterium]